MTIPIGINKIAIACAYMRLRISILNTNSIYLDQIVCVTSTDMWTVPQDTHTQYGVC